MTCSSLTHRPKNGSHYRTPCCQLRLGYLELHFRLGPQYLVTNRLTVQRCHLSKGRLKLQKLTSALILSCFCLATSLTASSAETGPALSILLAADQKNYTVGEVPNLQITVKNETSEVVVLPALPAFGLTTLTITDQSGQRVIPTLPVSQLWIDSHQYEISAGTTLVLFKPPFDSPENRWVPISYWGYHLNKPGVYRLSVELAIPPRTKSRNAISTTEPSPIYITIRGS